MAQHVLHSAPLSDMAACRHEVERRTHPLSHDDFELLSSELEAWRQQQTAAIKAAAAAAAQQQQPDQQVRRRAMFTASSSQATQIRILMH
jgi:hypothetical protein